MDVIIAFLQFMHSKLNTLRHVLRDIAAYVAVYVDEHEYHYNYSPGDIANHEY